MSDNIKTGDFVAIPSWAKEIIITYELPVFEIKLGDSDGVVKSGYVTTHRQDLIPNEQEEV